MGDPTERFRLLFFEEAHEAIDTIEQHLLALNGQTASTDTTNEIFRAAHSLKGGAATFGMTALTEFTHHMETLLDGIRSGHSLLSEDIIDCLFSSLDVLRNLLAHHQSNAALDVTLRTSVEKQLALFIEQQSIAQITPTQPLMTAANWQIYFKPDNTIMHTGNDPLRYIKQCKSLGDLTSTCHLNALPDWQDYDPTQIYLSWRLTLNNPQHDITRAAIDELFMWIEDECELVCSVLLTDGEPHVVAPQTSESQPENTSSQAAAEGLEKRQSQSIRVDLDKIDSLINLLGELVITQSMLSMFGESEQNNHNNRLNSGLSQLERHTRELQEGVMRIRMLPISFCFDRFPRVIRDMSKQLEKQVELEIVGEATEVDKTVIEELTDPLVHLVRNSLDHGIETPSQRLANGKPERGKLTLKAFHQVGNIVIEISDDGAGLNRDKIWAKAIEVGLVDTDRDYSEQDIFDLIFVPGFSTAAEVSDISGRGVGMDVVKRNIRALSGTIDVRSESNIGTTFTIRLPLTLAIVDGQLVRISHETYIIPLLTIIESIQISQHQVNSVSDKEVTFKWREEYIPLIKLGHLFGLQAEPDPVSNGLVVVVESDGKKCGLYVNELLTHQQVVVKSLESNYEQVPGISGATILGDGSVALILDIPSLIDQVRRP